MLEQASDDPTRDQTGTSLANYKGNILLSFILSSHLRFYLANFYHHLRAC